MKIKKILGYVTLVLLIIWGIYSIYDSYRSKEEAKAYQAWLNTLQSTGSENVQILTDTINIDYLDEKRTLAIYLPAGYAADTQDYSVIYFLDGQSLFDQKVDGTDWQLDEVLDSLGQLNQEQSIVVGIYNSERRMKEYKPFPSDRWYSDWVVSGDQHAEWIVKDLKPWIDSQYRTKPESAYTYIGGASLGGLMSYYMLMEYHDTFGGAFVFSPSYWVNEKVYTLHEQNDKLNQQRIYFDAGALETPTVDGIQKMEGILLEAGMPKENIKLDVEEGLGHWHITWTNGFRKAYPWMVRR